MLSELPGANVKVFVVWEPVLRTDWSRPGSGVLGRIRDHRVRQVWDKDAAIARRVGEAIHSDPAHPQPRCCEDNGIPWDMVLVYPSGVRWESRPPMAAFTDGPVWEVIARLKQALTEMSPPPEKP